LSATELWPVLTGLPPLIDECSRVLVLGSFPSKQSLAKQEYYGNAQNHFWQIMAKLFEFDPQAPYRGRTMALIASGVAVWDVIAECSREGSGDDAIQDATANPLLSLLRNHPHVRHIDGPANSPHLRSRPLRGWERRVAAVPIDEPAACAAKAGGQARGLAAT